MVEVEFNYQTLWMSMLMALLASFIIIFLPAIRLTIFYKTNLDNYWELLYKCVIRFVIISFINLVFIFSEVYVRIHHFESDILYFLGEINFNSLIGAIIGIVLSSTWILFFKILYYLKKKK